MQREPNYGRSREPGDSMDETAAVPAEGRSGGERLSPQDERTWSILSHASVLVWPVTGLLPVAPLIVWLLYKDRSPRVGFHALQSLWYQTAWLALGTVGGFLATVLTVLTFGIALFLIVPLALIVLLVPFAHQLYAAYMVAQGVDYRYPFIADRIDGYGE